MSYAVNEKTIVRASAGVFHNRVTLNDSTAARRQPAVPAAGQRQQRQRGQPRRRRRRSGPAVRHDRDRQGVQAPDRVHVLGRCPARTAARNFIVDAAYVGRRGLYLQRERNINQLPAGTIQANPGVNTAALRPYKGYGVIRLSRECRLLEVQQLPARHRPALHERVQLRAGVHARQVGRQRERQTDVMLNTLRRQRLLGALELRPPPRAELPLHLRSAVPEGAELAGVAHHWRMADFRLDLHAHRHAVVGDEHDGHRWRRRCLRQPYNLVSDPNENANQTFSQGVVSGAALDQNFWFNPERLRAAGRRHVR